MRDTIPDRGWGVLVARLFACAVLGTVLTGLRPPEVAAQTATADTTEEPEGFLGMSLEELMRSDVQEISVLGTHTHLAGEWMIGYKFMPMMMSGTRQGTTRLSTEGVLQQFMVAPTSMQMEMHMLEVMRALSDKVTFMAMVPYIELSMDHRTRANTTFTTRSAGLGDRGELETNFDRWLGSLWMGFQPIVRATDATIVGYEALARNDDPEVSHPGALFAAAAELGRSLEFMDVDRLKAFNDSHGHAVGDRVLIACAETLPQAVGARGRVFRYGGEEFAIVCPGVDSQAAAQIAEQTRRAVEDQARVHDDDGRQLSITCSIGVATHTGDTFDRCSRWVRAADQGMYAAKAAGRNCVRIWSPGNRAAGSAFEMAESVSENDSRSSPDLVHPIRRRRPDGVSDANGDQAVEPVVPR